MTDLIPRAVVKLTDERVKANRRIEAKERRVLFRSAGYGRTTMRRLIRRRKKKSPPGQPPHAHAPGLSGLKIVAFAIDFRKLETTIGHKRYYKRTNSISGKPVPQLLNEGGPATLINDQNEWTSIVIKPRPFRNQALDTATRFMRQLMKTQRL